MFTQLKAGQFGPPRSATQVAFYFKLYACLITLTPTANFSHIKTHSITDPMTTTRDLIVSAGSSQEKPRNA